MEENKNNNQSQSQNNINDNSYHNTPGFNPYINPYPPFGDAFEINWNTEIANILRDIRSNTERQVRINRDGTYTNFSIVFLVLIFIAYMLIGFYQNNGSNYPILCKLLAMILAILLLVMLLHRHEVNILENLNKNNENNFK